MHHTEISRALGLLASVARAYGSPNCKAEPIELPIRDIQVLPDIKDSLMKGVAAKVGTPPQNLVLLPWPELNNTWIYDDKPYCDGSIIWHERICRVRRGRLFNEEESDSFVKSNNVVAADGAPEEAVFGGSELGIKKLISTGLGGTETFRLDKTDAIQSFPIGIPRLSWDHGYTMLHPLGLGTNSTILSALRDAGQIASRVWSISWGRMWVDEPIDGSLVLGGYDENKVIGENYTAPLIFDHHDSSSGCWAGMKVTVSDIKINFRNGHDESILPPNTALPCCIVPQRQLLLEAPSSYLERFENATLTKIRDVSYGLHWSAQLFDADKAFDGDMTFHLTSGLDIRVLNDQYLVPFVEIGSSGQRLFKNETRELLMNGVANQPATLGRYFLTAAYLMVNNDAGTFTLWRANPSRTSADGDDVVVQPSQTPGEPDDGSGGPSAPPSPPSTAADEGPPVGIIAGAATGGGLFLLALVGLGLWLWRGRHGKVSAAVPEIELLEKSRKGGDGKGEGEGVVNEHSWNEAAPQELGSEPVVPEMHGNHIIHEI
ncbi:hypothetical protein HJFPF1_02593 [Paramyrothecium foliicola]|nr:hypothetical protein HJFPF1_02593 [Paramyrothecium foliicola]